MRVLVAATIVVLLRHFAIEIPILSIIALIFGTIAACLQDINEVCKRG